MACFTTRSLMGCTHISKASKFKPSRLRSKDSEAMCECNNCRIFELPNKVLAALSEGTRPSAQSPQPHLSFSTPGFIKPSGCQTPHQISSSLCRSSSEGFEVASRLETTLMKRSSSDLIESSPRMRPRTKRSKTNNEDENKENDALGSNRKEKLGYNNIVHLIIQAVYASSRSECTTFGIHFSGKPRKAESLRMVTISRIAFATGLGLSKVLVSGGIYK